MPLPQAEVPFTAQLNKNPACNVRIQVLVVEDDRALAALIVEYLDEEDMVCDLACNGLQAIELIRQNSYDALVLDINLPGCNGLDVCAALRAEGCNLPCIMLTARNTLEDKLAGFDVGADDYLVKPFAMAELVARINAIVTRHKHTKPLQIGDLQIDFAKRTAARGSYSLQLSPEEWKLLCHLARKSPAVVTRIELEDVLWPEGAPSQDAYKMAIYRLRKSLHLENATPLLHTVRGVGVTLRVQDNDR